MYDFYTFDTDTGLIRKQILQTDGIPYGRNRDMTAVGCLGLVLTWYRTRGSCARSLALHFGQTSTPMYKWLDFAQKVLLYCLINDHDAKIAHSTNEQVHFFQSLIAEKYPNVSEAWAAVDGLKLEFERPGKDMVQNTFFNGWTHGHYINSVFVFSPDGKIRMCLINAPGMFHDSAMSDYGIYEGMERVYLATGEKVVADSAFNVGKREYIIKSAQQDPLDMEGVLRNRDATSVRQLSEWGIRMIQGQFPRMHDRMRYESKGNRKIFLRLLIHLYNFQTAQVGVNQILNSFCEETEQTYTHFGHPNLATDANAMLR